jgi:hypothetical protein
VIKLAPLFVLALLAIATAATGDSDHEFVGAAKCRTCHKKELIGNQYAAWQAAVHHGAFETLKNEQSVAIAAERGLSAPAHEAAECLSCHVTGHGLPDDRFAYDLEPADGVQCESCHGPGRDYRKKKIMSDPEVAREKGLWDAESDAAICTACHNPESPTFDPERYTLADGSKAGFDFTLAKERIPHPIPEDVKGKFVELEEEEKRRKRAAGKGGE